MTARNIGGSLLASSNERILRRVETPFADFYVRPVPELDTHVLSASHGKGVSMLAEHPNGFSCHALLLLIVAGDVEKAKEQATYIQQCGGMARSLGTIAHFASEVARSKTGA